MNAPAERRVCQLTGKVSDRPSAFFEALAAADRHVDRDTFDHVCAQRDQLRDERDEALTRIQELEAEIAELQRDVRWHL